MTRDYLTVGLIAERLSAPVHRVQYVIRARGIEPSGRAGNVRIFTEQDVALIARELARSEPGRASNKKKVD